MGQTVFVSYAHTSDDHRRHVAELVAALRAAGLVVAFDGDVRTPQGPPEGWPRWMLDQLEAADWVLVVCEEVYHRRFRGKETLGVGLGARWEGAIIQQELYGQGAVNAKFIPVLFDGGRAEHIPEPLRGATHYCCPRDLPMLIAALQASVPGATRAPAVPPGARRARPHTARAPTPTAAQAGKPAHPSAAERTLLHAWMALGAFLCAVLLVVLWLWNAGALAGRWESAAFYYLILVVLGAAVGAFLFGALRSFGHYRGRVWGGGLELGGPIVASALVVLGGAHVFPPSAGNFPLTVYVHGESGPSDLMTGSVGYVLLDLGGDRRREQINDKGQALFAEIPASFRGQAVNVLLESDTYELTNPAAEHRLDRSGLYLPVRRKPGHIVGRVQDDAGRPVAGAQVDVAGLSARADASGRFSLVIRGARLTADPLLEARAEGFTPWRGVVVPDANEAVIVLARERQP